MRVFVQSTENRDLIPNGLLYRCTFDVAPSVLPGAYFLEVENASAIGRDGFTLSSRVIHGSIHVGLVPQPCVGDCDLSGRVRTDELVTGVRIALGRGSVFECQFLDEDESLDVSIDELVRAVEGATRGCSGSPAGRLHHAGGAGTQGSQ
jgi:hypothetical protein